MLRERLRAGPYIQLRPDTFPSIMHDRRRLCARYEHRQHIIIIQFTSEEPESLTTSRKHTAARPESRVFKRWRQHG